MPASPVPDDVAIELDRIERRWRQLPLERAEACAGRVRTLVQHLCSGRGAGAAPVPDLGPAVLVDQLRVVVHDACAAGTVPVARLAEDLVALRRDLP